jgi:DNA-binding GntR family transcriptional regulator
VSLDPEHVGHMYDMRALIEAGGKAVASGSVAKMIAADIRFHEFLYGLSGNPLVAPALDTHLTVTQRVMGEVLLRDEKPRDIWDQHAAILQAICERDAERAESLARQHITLASGFMVPRLKTHAAAG